MEEFLRIPPSLEKEKEKKNLLRFSQLPTVS